MLFHRKEEKYRLSLTDKEYRLLLDCLMIRRNKLLAEGRYQSMPPELMEKYKEQFKKPERFFRYCGKTVAVPIAERRGEEAR